MLDFLIAIGKFSLGISFILLGLGFLALTALVVFGVLPIMTAVQMYAGIFLMAVASFVFIKLMEEFKVTYKMSEDECKEYKAAKKQMRK